MLSYEGWLEEPYIDISCCQECGECRKRGTCTEWEECQQCGAYGMREEMTEGRWGYYCDYCKDAIKEEAE
jgi:hypothetical protein